MVGGRVLPDVSVALPATYARPAHWQVRDVAERLPDAVALVGPDATFSYCELMVAVAGVAEKLRALRLVPFTVVAIEARRNAALVVAMLAAWESEAAILVLDSKYPAAWRGRLLDRVKPAALIRLGEDGAIEVVRPEEPPRDFRGAVGPDFAYLASTSGSTGVPRIVVGGHQPLAHFLDWQRAEIGIGAGARVAMLSGLAHDPLLRDIFAPLTAGGTLLIPPEDTFRDAALLGGWLGDMRVEQVHWTPSLAGAVADGWDAALPALRYIFFGGEPLLRDRIGSVRRLAPQGELFNLYGATETPQGVSCARVAAEFAPIGPGISGVQILVIDADANPLGVGEIGEIGVRSPYLAHGYLDDDALTRARFISNPGTGGAGDLIYRTGDLGRARADGHIDFVGRADRQIKRGGVRVELAGLEQQVREHPAIRDAAAMVFGDLLVLFAVARSEAPATFASWMSEALPPAQCPDRVQWVDAIPLTPSGKVDGLALERLFGAAGDRPLDDLGDDLREPLRVLERIACRTLGLAAVGADEDLLALGMHSLQTLAFLGEIRRVFGVTVAVTELFADPVLRQLGKRVRDRRPRNAREPRPQRPGSPATPAQTALWLADLIGKHDGALHIPVLLELRGAIDDTALIGHVHAMQQRHETLRTSFREVDDGVEQVVTDATVALRIERCAEVVLRERVEASIAARFDLANGPLHRPVLFRSADHAVLAWTFHHCIFDGISRTLLVRELAGRIGGADPVGVPLTPRALAREDARADPATVDRYVARFNGCDRLDLAPVDAREADGSRAFALDSAMTARVRACASLHRTTPFAVVLAVFELVLARMTGRGAFTIGTPRATRDLRHENVLGCFVDLMMIRADVSLTQDFRTHLARVTREHRVSLGDGSVSLEQLRAGFRRACPERPFPIQAVLVLEEARITLDAGPCTLRELDWWTDRLRYELELHLWPESDGLAARLLYGGNFGEVQAGWFVEAFRLALEACCREPGLILRACPIEPADDIARRVRLGAGEDVAVAIVPLLEAIDAHAARAPDGAAVRFDGQVLAYGELVERANALAHALIGRGVGPGDRVAIWLPQGIDRVIAALAVLRSGAAYVPLERDNAEARRAFVLTDTRPRMVIGDRPIGDVPTLEVGRGRRRDAPIVAVPPDVDAYVIHTSGSTGRPKGVRVSRRNLDRLFSACAPWLGAGSNDVWSCCHSFAFDFSVWEIWGALRHGGCVVLAAREEVRDPGRLCAFLARERITVFSQTPSSFGQVVGAAGATDLSALRLIVFGGEVLDPELLAPWIARHGDARPALVNMYGITETTVHVTRRRITADDLSMAGSNIGRALSDMAIRVLDAAGNLAPAGMPGEIYVGGAGVSGGYLGQPALTAGRFLPDPWSETPGARLYRSGDQGLLLADGNVRYLGRLDDQVNLRGVRIELGEVEAALRSHPGIADAAALVHTVSDDDARLVAFVTAAADAPSVGTADVMCHLASRLPGGVTAQLFWCDALPLTDNGKVDRAALLALRTAARAKVRGNFTTRSLLETIVVETFCDVLELAELPGDADFFALGGHSLLATRLIARLRDMLRVDLPLGAVFDTPTVSGIADAVQEALDRRGTTTVEPITRDVGEGPYPAASAQRRIWFAQQEDESGFGYNARLNLAVSGALDRTALERALALVVERHEPLRTCLALQEGEVLQLVQPPTAVPVDFVDLSALDLPPRDIALERLKARHYDAGFDLERDRMVRFCLVRTAPEQHVLLTTFHHCAYDGRSSQIFLDELAQYYAAFAEGATPAGNGNRLRYADYAAWEHRHVRSDGVQAEIIARARLLRGVKPFRLPVDPAAEPASRMTGRVDRTLPPQVCVAAAALARATHSTVFMVLLSALELLLHRASGETEITLGLASANRSRGEVTDLIGMFVNLVAVTVEVDPDRSFAALLNAVREATLDALDHQDVPFERLVEAASPERRTTGTPLVHVLAAYHPWPECADFIAGGVQFSALPEGNSHARFDLEFHVWPDADGALRLRTIYRTAHFSGRAINTLLDHLDTILDDVLRSPDLPLHAPASEQQPQVAAPPAWPEQSILALFDAQAHQGPGLDAVVDGAERWSYARLHDLSLRIAGRLQAAGIGHGDIVAVAGSRSAWVVAALVGILRAGAAYLPIDPEAPADWQRRLLGKAALALLAEDVALPEIETRQIVLAEASFPAARPAAVATAPDDLAYINFTSGSTGAPSGVMVPHRGILQLIADMRYAPIRPGDRVAHAAALSFDATTFEVWGALTHGGTIVVIPRETVLDPARFGAVIREGFGAIFLTTTLFNRLAEQTPDVFDAVRTLLVGGEKADGRLMARVRPERLVHVYGPTECTTFATWHLADRVDGSTVPIGGPLPFARAHVLDAGLHAVPSGLAGELHIGGPGLAWGYLDDPRKTAERFVPDPFALEPGARLYRTGDRVRQDADGVIDFLGRVDRQVKIRGFRIEPAALEAELQQHPEVARAVVTVVEDAMLGARLSAFVVPQEVLEAGGIEDWEAVFDERVYQLAEGTADPVFDTRGWIDSRTAQSIPEPAMRDWAEDIAQAALAHAPRRVLDIGCGLGIHLFRLAPHVAHYQATDVSQAALDFVAERLPLLGEASGRVSLSRIPAHRIAEVAEGKADLILLVSVAQYFPSLAYFREVIEAAERCLAPGGTILIGDLRSLPLLRTFHSWVVAANAAPGQSLAQQRSEVERRLATEREFAVDPRFFEACVAEMPGLAQVRLALSGGLRTNELTLFRYMAELRREALPEAEVHVVAGGRLGEGEVRKLLAEHAALLLRDVPNALTEAALAAEARHFPELGRPPANTLDRAMLWRIAGETGRVVDLASAASGARDRIDVIFSMPANRAVLPYGPSAPAGAFANRPIDVSLATRLRDFLAARLPSYMLPTSITIVNEVPLTVTGKTDRATLRTWEQVHDASELVKPEDDMEEVLCLFWAEALGRDRVGPEDSFFDLGGHSLLAIRLVEVLRSTFGARIPLSWLFEHPTVRTMALALQDGETSRGDMRACAGAYLELARMSDGELETLAPHALEVGRGRL